MRCIQAGSLRVICVRSFATRIHTTLHDLACRRVQAGLLEIQFDEGLVAGPQAVCIRPPAGSSAFLLVSSARACQRIAVLRKIDHRTKGLAAERGAFTSCANCRVDLI